MVHKNTYPVMLETAVDYQRQLIKEHLTHFILADKLPIDDPNSFFQIAPPAEEEEGYAREFYDRAHGDAGLYAIYWAMEYARERLEDAQLSGDPAAVEAARSDLTEVRYLEQAYVDPADNPFVPVYDQAIQEEPPF